MADPDRRRFERLYAAHFDRVAAYLLARSDDRDAAADSVARTFEIAWRRLDDVPAEPLPWLLGVARRVRADALRAHRRRDALAQRAGDVLPGVSGDPADAIGEREHVLRALESLPCAQREALLLVAWDGLSEREAAAVLGCSRGAVALRVLRARRHLRAALRGAPGAPHPSMNPSIKEAT